MITVREISDNNSNISSTRWAFAVTIVFDMIVIALSLAAYLAFHFLKKPIEESFLYAVVTLLGVLTGITGTTKALQGFETQKTETKEKEAEEK